MRFGSAHDGFRTLGTPVPAGLALAGVARCDEAEGDVVLAKQGYEQVLATGQSVGEPGLIATALEGLARLAASGDKGDEVQRLLDEASAVRERSRRPAPPHELNDLELLTSSH